MNYAHQYINHMDDYSDLPKMTDYVSIREAANMLGLAERTVYVYVQEGKIPALRIADVIAIPIEEVKKFKRGPAGRPRTNTPTWRISTGKNIHYMTTISVKLRPGQLDAFTQRLEVMRKKGLHTFPGTVARYIVEDDREPGRVQIALVWRGTVMPDEATREQYLGELRETLGDVLDWQTADYHHGRVFMHT